MHKRLSAMLVCATALAGCAAPESGDALKSVFDSGVAAYDAGDYAKAYQIWSGIDDIDLAAMRNVAMMLRQGQGVAKNPKKAEELYETAAAAGLPTAQADLADMLLKGEAGPPNPKAALPLLAAAAAANHPMAQFELAEFYETGQDGLVPKDIAMAAQLYAAAAAHGMEEAQTRLDQLPRPNAPSANAPLRLMQPAPAAKSPVTTASGGGGLRPAQP